VGAKVFGDLKSNYIIVSMHTETVAAATSVHHYQSHINELTNQMNQCKVS